MNLVNNDTVTRPLTFKVLLIPILIEQFFALLLSNIDVLMLSNYSDDAVAAVGISAQLLNLAFMLVGIITIGCSIQLFQMNEHLHRETIAQVIAHIIYFTLLTAIVIAGVFYVFATPLLQLMQTPTSLMDTANSYIRIVAISLIFQAVISSISVVLRSFAIVRFVMYISIAINVCNIIGNYIVLNTSFSIFGTGVTGIATVTLLVRILGSICILFFFVKYFQQYRKALFQPNLSRKMTGRILSLGFPSAFENISYNVSQTVITAFIASLGTLIVTTKVYASTISLVVFAVAASMSTVNQMIIGKMIGRGEKVDASRYTNSVLKWSFVTTIAMTLLLALSSKSIISIFTDNNAIITLVQQLLWLNILLETARALNEILVGAINVAGEVKYPTYLNIVTTFLLVIPSCFFIVKYTSFGIYGIWYIFIVDEYLRLLLLAAYWLKGKWQRITIIQS